MIVVRIYGTRLIAIMYALTRTYRAQALWLLLSWLVCCHHIAGQTCLPGGISFTNQAQIDDFPLMYPGCHEISGHVLIEESMGSTIRSLEGLSQVSRIGQFLEIRNNGNIADLAGLENLKSIGGRLTISSNFSLHDIDALDNINFIGESFRISANPSISGINAFSKLKVIRGDLSIADNASLSNMSGLQNLVEIDGGVLINGNAILSSLNGFNSLRKISGGLLVRDNPSLKDLSGLPDLREVLADFIIDNNRSLLSLSGLNKLSSVGGYLQIVNNESLQNVKGLDSLEAIYGLLQIYNNPQLENLHGLDSINAQSIDNLAIIDCPGLKNCSVESICNFLKRNEDNYSILRNGVGCNNKLQILMSCDREANTVTPQPNVIILFPNPTNGLVRIKGSITEATLTVHDITGRLLIEGAQVGDLIDLNNLAAGVYRVGLVSPNKSFIGIIIKI